MSLSQPRRHSQSDSLETRTSPLQPQRHRQLERSSKTEENQVAQLLDAPDPQSTPGIQLRLLGHLMRGNLR